MDDFIAIGIAIFQFSGKINFALVIFTFYIGSLCGVFSSGSVCNDDITVIFEQNIFVEFEFYRISCHLILIIIHVIVVDVVIGFLYLILFWSPFLQREFRLSK